MTEKHLLQLKDYLDNSGNYRYDEKGCKLWLGATTNGYGQLWHFDEKKNYKVHRLALAISEDLPYHDDFLACHKCDTPLCYEIGSNHVYRGDLSTNSKDFQERFLTCPNGHEKTPENTGYETKDNGRRKTYCRVCKRDRHKEWRKNNPEKYRESQRNWRDSQ